ncbi:helix-turn-helix transcriptional regulator [Spirillospora sp. NPDC029432]|uniref:helix-turn-helix domain-containing protein n=1 Tax=Spirillospora sp. NPDC029432 TaxID=3154599 RepID=UPI003454B82E
MTEGPQSPTLRRRRLSAELRSLRDQSGLTATQVAKRLDWQTSKLTRMERGEWQRPNPRDIVDLLNVYGVVDERQRETLVVLARQGRQRGWWHAYKDMLSERYSTYIGLEIEASSLRTFQPLMVPGLLQTVDYARALILDGPAEITAEEVERRVDIRAERQKILVGPRPPELSVILDEAAIRRRVGDGEIMRSQLKHLQDAAALPHIGVRVVPFEAGAHAGMTGAFSILSFAEDRDPDAVYVETIAGELFIEEAEEVQSYQLAFRRLNAVALTPRDTLSMISAMAAQV